MSEPIVSFVIPVYKKNPDVFRRCLSSLFDMSLKEIEVICVFDGPDEELQKVASDFKVIALVIDHGGACKARNAGFEMASGKYVVAWDADCYAKPGMAKRWVDEFEAVPDADFVYTGYEFAGERGAFESEPFDAFSLQCGNYISSMSPIKREKAHKWDESLPAAQDWDYWLTAVERGLKGVWIEGAGFETDAIGSGISSVHWSAEKREETIARVRDKHGIPCRKVGVYSLRYRDRAIKIAKILDADLIKATGRDPSTYDVVVCVGYGPISRFDGFSDSTAKVQYWLPMEVEALTEAKYQTVMETIRVAKGVTNICGTELEKNKLAEMGITAEVLPLPLSNEDLAKTETTLPEEFSALVMTDKQYGELLKDIAVDLPHIKFGFNAGKTKDYSCVISFFQFPVVDEALLMAHINGRNVISNVQAPYCGFIDPDQTWDKFKAELYAAIREAKDKGWNASAVEYYAALAKPDAFIKRIESLIPVKPLEVVA